MTSVNVRCVMWAFQDARRNSSSCGSTPGHWPWYAAVRQWSLAAEQVQHLPQGRPEKVVFGRGRVTRIAGVMVIDAHERFPPGNAALHPHGRHRRTQHGLAGDAIAAHPHHTVGLVRHVRRAAPPARGGVQTGEAGLLDDPFDLTHFRVLCAEDEDGVWFEFHDVNCGGIDEAVVDRPEPTCMSASPVIAYHPCQCGVR